QNSSGRERTRNKDHNYVMNRFYTEDSGIRGSHRNSLEKPGYKAPKATRSTNSREKPGYRAPKATRSTNSREKPGYRAPNSTRR
ncbi:hypothetical protein, partial [Cohnella soli]